MGKVGMTAILEAQLEAANATIRQLSLRLESVTKTMEEQSATIKSMESTIRNLEELLLRKEDALSSAEEQKRALGKLIEKKNEKVKTAFVPKTEEERAEEDRSREEERKARGNNGARRNMHYEMTVEQKDNLRWRRTYAPPILKKLKAALQKVVGSQDTYPPKSPMYKAARYFLNEFDGIDFFEYLTDVINRVAAMGARATADTCRDLLPDKWEKGQ